MSPRSWFIIFLLSARCCLSVAKSRESSRRGGEPGRKRRSFRFSLFFSRVGRADSISITSTVYSFRLFGPMSRPIGARGSIISPIFCVCYWIAMRKLGKWRLDWRCGFPFDYFFFPLQRIRLVLFELPRLAAGSICSKIVFFCSPLSAQSVCFYSGGRNLRTRTCGRSFI